MAKLLLIGLIAIWPWSPVSAADQAAWNAYVRDGLSAYERGDYTTAKRQLELAVNEAESFGAQDPRLGISLNNLALVNYNLQRYADAESLYRRSIAISEKALGPEHPELATSLHNLASLLYSMGRYADAEPLYRRAIDIREKALGLEHSDVAQSLSNLGLLYNTQGRYADAETLYKLALTIWSKTLGTDHPAVALGLFNLAGLYQTQGRYSDAEPLYKLSIAIRERAFGPSHPDVAESLNGLAMLYSTQGRHADAESLFNRSLLIREKALGPEHSDVATSLSNLAQLYYTQGRYADAEPLFRRSIAIQERVVGTSHATVAISLNNLGMLYGDQGRYSEAEVLLKRSLAIKENTFGPEHPDVGNSLNNLASVYYVQGRITDAELLYKRALAIAETTLGHEHPSVGTSLNNLALVYHAQGRTAEAESLYKRALAIAETALGREHARVASSLNNLGQLYYSQGRYVDAEPLLKRSHSIVENTSGSEHPNVATSLANLAALSAGQGRNQDALSFIRRATHIRKARATLTQHQLSGNNLSEQRTYARGYIDHVDLLDRVLAADPTQRTSLIEESFEVSQLARANDTATAIARMAARFAKGDDELARLTRSHQDTLARWRFVDGELLKAVSNPAVQRNEEHERNLRQELVSLNNRLVEFEATFAKRFPEYKSLTAPEPLKLVDAQALLGADEALITYLVGREHSFLWVLRRKQAQFLRLDIGKAELDKTVQQFRRQLDISEGVLRPFALAEAHALYQRVFLPAEALLKGATHVMVVANGALESLPFGILVTEAPGKPSDYRNTAWLAKRYALSVLPSEGSLRALRRFARGIPGNQPFSGFGDPALEGGSQSRGVSITALFSRGAIADVRAVKQLERLPDTADELYAMANSLGADKQAVHLQHAATETNVKRADLSRYRVLAFATHGLMAGDFTGLAEPALVLTPPDQGTEFDDGLLTASEVAQLKLNAEWVILSACNTAAADGTPGAEGLSGLAKAFFYAGSRALLVSHWPVSSGATVKLTTRMFKEAADTPNVGRAEALRRSMLALMVDDKAPEYSHPAFWAPFVVVGEGSGQLTR